MSKVVKIMVSIDVILLALFIGYILIRALVPNEISLPHYLPYLIYTLIVLTLSAGLYILDSKVGKKIFD